MMTTEQKIIKTKVGVLELAKQLEHFCTVLPVWALETRWLIS
jgi:hypothetical protein